MPRVQIPGLGPEQYLGWSVDVSGDTAIVGAPRSSEFGEGSGSALLFQRGEDGSWRSIARIPSPVHQADARFGSAVAIHGDYAAVAPIVQQRPGEVYVYARRPDGSWDIEHPAILRSGTFLPDDQFGYALDMDRGQLIVGQGSTPQGKTLYASGQAWVFERTGPGNRWSAGTPLTREHFDPVNEGFGRSVGIDGEWALVGAEPGQSGNDTSATLFRRVKAGSWKRVTELRNPGTPHANVKFGISVALRDGLAVVGAPGAGAVYVYRLQEGTETWSGPSLLYHPVVEQDPKMAAWFRFGVDVDTQGGRVLAGYPTYPMSGTGGAMLFEWTGSAWKATNLTAADRGDSFGAAVALDGDRIVVGDWHSSAQALFSGAIFAR